MASDSPPNSRPALAKRSSIGNVIKLQEEDGSDRVLMAGRPDYTRCDNTLITSKYTILNFLPITIRNQFRRFANMYFLIVGLIMYVGTYQPQLYASAFSPWTTWGPLFMFISISLLGEGIADKKRHLSDYKTNTFRCIVVENEKADTKPVNASMANSVNNSMVKASSKNRKNAATADENALNEMPCGPVPNPNGRSNAVCRPIQRKDIRQGHIVVVRNREMIPADIVLLASSGDRGCAYVETSSIDGETNLKLRLSAKHKSDPSFNRAHETLEEAIRRIAGFTAVGNGESAIDLVAELNSEPPDAHINTFTGLLKFPTRATIDEENVTNGETLDLPLGADNLLLRGAILRNTAWAIGVACFTGTDTKLSQNTVEAPSKFSQLDRITNKCVLVMIFVEAVCIAYLSTFAVLINGRRIEEQWYLGRKSGSAQSAPWPYLPDLPDPEWETNGDNWIQYAMTNITLLSYFVPLSMYFTLEVCNFFLMWLIYVDVNIYDATTDTRAEPRSTIYTDLGQIQYIFSDKTGTLTQNVMRFKRCSVDGMIFGNPIKKEESDKNEKDKSSFFPIKQVLVGQIHVAADGKKLETNKGMTFNAELFIRVMSLCHTVVVEKDLDLPKDDNYGGNETGNLMTGKAADGAPLGYAYQAESPDEGALVSEASTTFGVQVLDRDSSGIRLKCEYPSLFSDEQLVRDLKSGRIGPATVATQSSSGLRTFNGSGSGSDHVETWSVLAINKFDSTRKRMSILLRSPPEFGNCAILFCKGADSAMLDPDVCSSSQTLRVGNDELRSSAKDESDWAVAKMLGIETHLGEFASEGLRTLVLGVRFLTDDQCDKWLKMHTKAAAAIKGRDEKLTKAAFEIEKELHIVGATAIEDKLQVRVPQTIATLEKAGVKLWVLTGDKRETAIEIGYSTNVLTPRMHVTQMADRGEKFVRAQCAMEFMRLVKAGKLPLYQRAVVDQEENSFPLTRMFRCFGNIVSTFSQSLKRMMLVLNLFFRTTLKMKTRESSQRLDSWDEMVEAEKQILSDNVRRRNVRNRAEAILKEYTKNHKSTTKNPVELSSDALPPVFSRAQSAQEMLDQRRSQGKLTEVDKRASELAQLNAQEQAENPTIDDDMLSLQSVMPSNNKSTSNFDRKKRTVLENMFAVDRQVRKGQLMKHLKKEKRDALSAASSTLAIAPTSEGPRGLVIEGAALKHLQGDDELEELVFSVASQCESVIACRVTPRQKAQLVTLVRQRVVPEPVTLAIGDGANDVGMIHAAHVGIGISGKEGQQAVNASDFSIGQFRFLEDLILYHGRWDFMRTTKVVLYTFYKNAIMSCLLVLYNNETLFSGTSCFDQWLMAGFSFACFFPILSIGMFDRNLEKSYIKKNPEVYKPTRQNEMITPRILFRWAILTIAHTGILYYGQLRQLTRGATNTAAFMGLMWNKGTIGDGEVADWQSFGTTMFTSLVLLMSYKVLYESRSIINGKIPVIFALCEKTGDGFTSRIPYTWWGILIGSVAVYAFGLSLLDQIGIYFGSDAGSWFVMVGAPARVFLTSSSNYATMLFIPVGAMAFDVAGKVFSNMFYPSQIQIHIELEAKEIRDRRRL